MPAQHITFVKKVLADGTPCRKCTDVEARLAASGQAHRIDETLVADERDPDSAGMRLAAELGVERAPFFVVTAADGTRTVHTIYFKFAKDVLGAGEAPKADAARDILDANPDLDYL